MDNRNDPPVTPHLSDGEVLLTQNMDRRELVQRGSVPSNRSADIQVSTCIGMSTTCLGHSLKVSLRWPVSYSRWRTHLSRLRSPLTPTGIFRGCGLLLSLTLIVTCAHVVDLRLEGQPDATWRHFRRQKILVNSIEAYILQAGFHMAGQLDIAFLQTANNVPINHPPISLCRTHIRLHRVQMSLAALSDFCVVNFFRIESRARSERSFPTPPSLDHCQRRRN